MRRRGGPHTQSTGSTCPPAPGAPSPKRDRSQPQRVNRAQTGVGPAHGHSRTVGAQGHFARSPRSVRGEGMRQTPRPECHQVAATITHGVPLVPGEGHRPWRLGRRFAKQPLADAPRLAQALASAFQDDPVITWIFPDQQRRRHVLPAFMAFRLRRLAFPHDEVWMTTGAAAAAVWLPPPGEMAAAPPAAAAAVACPGPVLWSADGLGVGWAGAHGGAASTVSAAWYLFIYGTEPAAQGRGWARPC
jgi:hypothetical protein